MIKKCTSLDFESVIVQHLTGKIFSFDFYPKAIYYECKFWISRSAITDVPFFPWFEHAESFMDPILGQLELILLLLSK